MKLCQLEETGKFRRPPKQLQERTLNPQPLNLNQSLPAWKKRVGIETPRYSLM